MTQPEPKKKFQLQSKTKWNLFTKRAQLIKKKQELYSWLEFYTHNLERPELERFKLVPENQQYPNINRTKKQIEAVDIELKAIEESLSK